MVIWRVTRCGKIRREETKHDLLRSQLNGQVLCTAGVGELGVLTAIVSWVRRNSALCPEGVNKEEWSAEELNLSVGGSSALGEHGHEFLDWIKEQALKVGDEMTIRILDQSKCDVPFRRRRESSDFVKEKKREYLETLKKEFEEDELA